MPKVVPPDGSMPAAKAAAAAAEAEAEAEAEVEIAPSVVQVVAARRRMTKAAIPYLYQKKVRLKNDNCAKQFITIPASASDNKLGLTIEFSASFQGALIRAIDPSVCNKNVAKQISVGDRIIANNGRIVECADDLKPFRNTNGVRLFSVIPASAVLVAAQLSDITTPLKHNVVTQIATHLELNNNVLPLLSQAQFITGASRDFPFLKEVDWEREKRKIRMMRMMNQQHEMMVQPNNIAQERIGEEQRGIAKASSAYTLSITPNNSTMYGFTILSTRRRDFS